MYFIKIDIDNIQLIMISGCCQLMSAALGNVFTYVKIDISKKFEGKQEKAYFKWTREERQDSVIQWL